MKKVLKTLIILSAAPLFGQNIYINEYLAGNDACCTDENGEYDDFIEIYNGGSASVDLGGMYITDDLSKTTEWQIPITAPDSTTIDPGGFLVLWADKDSEQGILHVEIKLSVDGEQIGLYASDGSTVVDTLTFDAQTDDVSQGRNPDGSETWATLTTPTPGTTNGSVSVNEQINLPSSITLEQNYPNPFNPTTTISYDLPKRSQVTLGIYDLLGKQIKTLVNQSQDVGNKIAVWDGTDNLGRQVSAGVYLYQIQAGEFIQTRKMLLLKQISFLNHFPNLNLENDGCTVGMKE